VNPRFNGLAAGDITGDGAPDLFFVDSDLGAQPPGHDINDRLLVNDGNGFFVDDSKAFLQPDMLESWYGTAVEIVDMNGDGLPDIVKNSAPIPTFRISIIYHSINTPGVFDVMEAVNQNAPTFFSIGDLDVDGLPDIVATDDGADRYQLNLGPGPDQLADFGNFVFPGPDQGFGGNSVVADLDLDGLPDVIIADVDNEIASCTRETRFFRNLGGITTATFENATPGGMSAADLEGVHDVAVFDIDGDGFDDVVLGRCTGNRVWIQQPPLGFEFAYAPEPPNVLAPDTPTTFPVEITGIGGLTADPASATLFVSTGGAFTDTPLVHLGGDAYEATLPALPCLERLSYYTSVTAVEGGTFTDPPGAPADAYGAVAATGSEVTFDDDIEGDVSGWTIVNGPLLVSGAWEAADPNGTMVGPDPASPEDDATPGGTKAFVTGPGTPGGAASADDVDGGPATLVSPVIDLDGADARVTYARWFFTSNAGAPQGDELRVEITSDGAEWVEVEEHLTTGTNGAWETVSLIVGDHVTPSATVQVRFVTEDQPNDSVTEAGVDDFRVETFLCTEPCPGDVDGSGAVGFGDILHLIGLWGTCDGCPEDLDGSGDVGFGDVLMVIGAWGPC
jgi:hypothetical protein